MTKIEEIKTKLKENRASLVVAYENGRIKEYYQNRTKDLVSILQEDKNALKNSIIADKVVGKVAACIMAVAGIKEIYADTLSQMAIPVLEQYNIPYSYGCMVEFIKNKDQTGMCPMETKYQLETDTIKIYQEMMGR